MDYEEVEAALFQFGERDVADQHEFDWLLRHFGNETFAPNNSDFDKTVCIMAVPADDDATHGIGPEDKHATVLYFGDWDKHSEPEKMEAAKGALKTALTLAAEATGPFTARVKKIEALGDEGAQVWLLDSPDLTSTFESLRRDPEIEDLYEGADATRYPEYTPHVTIGYEGVPPEAQQVKEIEFDRLSLWWGNEHIDFPLGASEFSALLEQFWDESQHERAEKGEPGGGRFIPKDKGGDGADKVGKDGSTKKVKEEPKMTKAQRTAALVKGVLAALDDVLDDLSSAQARALIKQIKANAKAFIDGQAKSTPGHGGGGGKKGGGTKDTNTPGHASPEGKKGGGTKDTNTPGHDSGGGSKSAEAGLAGMIKGLTGLLKGFGKNMKPKDRDKLNKALKDLQNL